MANDNLSTSDLTKLTYPGLNLKDNTLGEQETVINYPLEHVRSRSPPTHDLGALDRLPLELLSDLLLYASVADLVRFTQVNRRARQVVNAIPAWKTVLNHGHLVLRGLLATGLAHHITLTDVHDAMITSKCVDCGDFGGYIYVPTCTRVCFLCFNEKSRYHPLSIAEAARTFGIDRKTVSTLPTMKSVAGKYSANGKSCPKRLVLIDAQMARGMGLAVHGSENAMNKHVAEAAAERAEAYHSRLEAWRNSGGHGRAPQAPPLLDNALNSWGPRRYMAIVQAPCTDATGHNVSWGFHCSGCRGSYLRRPLHHRRKFDSETFRTHLEQCGNIDNGSHVLLGS